MSDNLLDLIRELCLYSRSYSEVLYYHDYRAKRKQPLLVSPTGVVLAHVHSNWETQEEILRVYTDEVGGEDVTCTPSIYMSSDTDKTLIEFAEERILKGFLTPEKAREAYELVKSLLAGKSILYGSSWVAPDADVYHLLTIDGHCIAEIIDLLEGEDPTPFRVFITAHLVINGRIYDPFNQYYTGSLDSAKEYVENQIAKLSDSLFKIQDT